MGKMMENDGTWDVLEFLWFFWVLVLAILRGNLEFNLWQFQEGIILNHVKLWPKLKEWWDDGTGFSQS